MIKKVIKFSADWCIPCKVYEKTFHDVSKNKEFEGVLFETFDVEDNEDLASEYMIRSVPTTVVLDENDKVLLKISGNLSKKALEDALHSI